MNKSSGTTVYMDGKVSKEDQTIIKHDTMKMSVWCKLPVFREATHQTAQERLQVDEHMM